jgi:hypothetical protein
MTDLQIVKVTTLEEFIERLKHIDWYWRFSDDSRVCPKGRAQEEYYQQLARDNGEEWCVAYDNQKAKTFSKERGFSGNPKPIRRTSIVQEWLRSPEYKAAMDDMAERFKHVPTHELEWED